jgi:hypothetical protein
MMLEDVLKRHPNAKRLISAAVTADGEQLAKGMGWAQTEDGRELSSDRK